MDLESCVLRIILCFQYPIHLSNQNNEFYHTISIETYVLPLSHKFSSKIPYVWNYLGISPYFETRFLDNRVIAKWNSKKKICGTRVPFKELGFHLNIFKELDLHELEFHELEFLEWNSNSTIFYFILLFFLSFIFYNSIVQKSSFIFKTWFLENRVSKQRHISKQFQTWGILLKNL